MAIKRTTLRSSTGTKLYAVRNADGSFKDIQTFKRAHSADLRKTGTASDSKKKPAAKKTVKKAIKKVVKKVAKAVKKVVKKTTKPAKKAVKKIVKKAIKKPAAKKK